MSYTVGLVINTGSPDGLTEVLNCGNYTYNISPMYRLAFRNNEGLNTINKIQASNAYPILTSAISNMIAFPEDYKKLNPGNGWGNYEGALDFLQRIQLACEVHPFCTVSIY
jgi:hypothetical protein